MLEELFPVKVAGKIALLYIERVVAAFYFITDRAYFIVRFVVSVLAHRAVIVVSASAGAIVGWVWVVHSG